MIAYGGIRHPKNHLKHHTAYLPGLIRAVSNVIRTLPDSI
jgi:hypothetical protein